MLKATEIQKLVKSVLEKSPHTRNSDKELIWSISYELGLNQGGSINEESFLKMPCLESITRARRKIQNKDGLYLSDKQIKERREGLREEFRQEYGRADTL